MQWVPVMRSLTVSYEYDKIHRKTHAIASFFSKVQASKKHVIIVSFKFFNIF